MHTQFYKRLLFILSVLAVFVQAKAQIVLEKKLADIIATLPQPPDSLQKAVDAYGAVTMGETPAEFRSALDELNKTRETILKPLYDKLTAVSASGSLANYSPEEQKFLRDAQTLRGAWGNGVMYGFDSWIEYRPGIAKQFWTKIKQPLSATAQGYYQQLLQIEKSLTWQTFLEEAREREGVIFKDAKIDAIQIEFSSALSAVPTKKVKFEGSDAMVDMVDPDKSIEVINRFDTRIDKVFKQVYNEQYGWWNSNFRRVKSAALKLDEVLQATAYGANLTGNDAQLVPAIADLQGRIVSLLHHLTNIGTKIISIAQLAQMNKTMTAESIKSMKAMRGQ